MQFFLNNIINRARIFFFNMFSISDVDVLVIMVTNEAQAESVLYGDLGAVPGNAQVAVSILPICVEQH